MHNTPDTPATPKDFNKTSPEMEQQMIDIRENSKADISKISNTFVGRYKDPNVFWPAKIAKIAKIQKKSVNIPVLEPSTQTPASPSPSASK